MTWRSWAGWTVRGCGWPRCRCERGRPSWVPTSCCSSWWRPPPRGTPARPSWPLSRSLSCLSTPAGSISKYVKYIYYTLILSIRLLVAGLHSANKQSYIHYGLKMELAASLVAGLHSWDSDQLWAQLQLHRWWHDNQHRGLCRGWGTRASGGVLDYFSTNIYWMWPCVRNRVPDRGRCLQSSAANE